MAKIAACNIVGPDGTLVLAGEDVPDGWPEELLAGLEAGGGIVDSAYDEDAHYSGPDGE